jgi:hypothetical protein
VYLDVLLHIACQFDHQPVTLICINSRTWKLAIHSYNCLGLVQASHIQVTQLQHATITSMSMVLKTGMIL